MPTDRPGRRLADHARTALAELPDGATDLVRRILRPPPVERAVAGARDRARHVTESVADAVPFGDDSLDLRLHRARRALEDAEAAEREALNRMAEADEMNGRAREVVSEGQRRLQQAKADGAAEVKRRVAEARRRADEMVADERSEAQADAARALEHVAADNDAEREEAEHAAQLARERALADMASAQEQLGQARALADEAAAAARGAADEAHRRARAVADQAEAQTRTAEERAAEADRTRDDVAVQAAELAKETDEAAAVDDLSGRSKAELLDLAASLDVAGRSGMTKAQLLAAVRRASTTTLRAAAAANGAGS